MRSLLLVVPLVSVLALILRGFVLRVFLVLVLILVLILVLVLIKILVLVFHFGYPTFLI